MRPKLYLTKLKPERRADYIDAHRSVSSDLMRRYRDAGMRLCAVYLWNDYLVLLTDADDHERTAAILAADPVDREWQAFVGPMKAEGDWQEMQELFFADLSK